MSGRLFKDDVVQFELTNDQVFTIEHSILVTNVLYGGTNDGELEVSLKVTPDGGSTTTPSFRVVCKAFHEGQRGQAWLVNLYLGKGSSIRRSGGNGAYVVTGIKVHEGTNLPQGQFEQLISAVKEIPNEAVKDMALKRLSDEVSKEFMSKVREEFDKTLVEVAEQYFTEDSNGDQE